MTVLIVAVALAVGISAMCSLLESVLYSTRVITLEAEPSRASEIMRLLKAQIDRPLAAILILNTIANTAGAALAGWAAGQVWGPHSLLAFSVVFTLTILLCSEIIPKTVGAIYWRGLWRVSTVPLLWMTRVLSPLIWLTRVVTRLITGGRDEEAPVSEEEIVAAARLGANGGEISSLEADLIRNIIKLEESTAQDIMTPRTVLLTMDGSLTVGQTQSQARNWNYSRVPVWVGDPERVVGYALKADILGAQGRELAERLKDRVKPIRFVPASANALNLLQSFLRGRDHLSLVVDEYGQIMGLVTLEDVLESMVGAEIVDEMDAVVDMQVLARRRAEAFMRAKEDIAEPEELAAKEKP